MSDENTSRRRMGGRNGYTEYGSSGGGSSASRKGTAGDRGMTSSGRASVSSGRSGSRYSDKRQEDAGRKSSGTRKRTSSGKSSTRRPRTYRKKGGRKKIILILTAVVLLLAAGGLLAGNHVIRKQKEEKEARELAAQISVNLDTLDSPYAILLDGTAGEVIASKRGDEIIYPASMVKIMTVLTVIDHIKNLDETTTMSYDFYEDLYAQDASRAGFEPGEEAVIRDLLYGALLPSGAECCMQLAILAAGSEEGFAELMNEKAQELGLTQTHFTNATGLHNEDQYSTPHEIGKILMAALKNDTFYQVFTTHYYTVQPTSVHPEGFTFWSTMFKNMESETVNGGQIMGGKTGYTEEAGHCLASMAEINGLPYILVTAGWASDPRTESYHINDAFLAYNQIAADDSAAM